MDIPKRVFEIPMGILLVKQERVKHAINMTTIMKGEADRMLAQYDEVLELCGGGTAKDRSDVDQRRMVCIEAIRALGNLIFIQNEASETIDHLIKERLKIEKPD